MDYLPYEQRPVSTGYGGSLNGVWAQGPKLKTGKA